MPRTMAALTTWAEYLIGLNCVAPKTRSMAKVGLAASLPFS